MRGRLSASPAIFRYRALVPLFVRGGDHLGWQPCTIKLGSLRSLYNDFLEARWLIFLLATSL